MRAGLTGARGPVEGDFLPSSPGPVTLLLAFLIRLRMGALALAAAPTHRTVHPTLGTGLKISSFSRLPTPPPQVYRRSWGLTAGKSRGVPGQSTCCHGHDYGLIESFLASSSPLGIGQHGNYRLVIRSFLLG